jgi:hypothetical protein
MTQATISLLDLPVELQLMVFKQLNYSSLVALAQTCLKYRYLVKIEPPRDLSQTLRLELLGSMEKWEMWVIFSYKISLSCLNSDLLPQLSQTSCLRHLP